MLSGDYDGRDFNILVYLAQADVPYIQYLTMEADAEKIDEVASVSSSNIGCGRCNSGFVAVALILPLTLLFKRRK